MTDLYEPSDDATLFVGHAFEPGAEKCCRCGAAIEWAEDHPRTPCAAAVLGVETQANLPDSFADHPQSVTEARSRKARDAARRGASRALRRALREIDSGEKDFEALVVVGARRHPDGTTTTTYYNAAPNVWTSLGLLARAQFMMQED